jgi:hypothetical protein
MSQQHDSHSGGGGEEWVAKHLGGLIMPFGKKFEGFIEKIMFFLINDYFRKIAVIYMVILTPIIVLEFFVHFVRL